MKKPNGGVLALVLFGAIAVMVYFVLSRYSSGSIPLLSNSQEPITTTSEESSFIRSTDVEGNHTVEITAEVVAIEQREVTPENWQETFLVLKVPENDATFEVGLGPEKQMIFFRNERLALTTQEENVKTADTYPSTEVAKMLSVGDTVTVQFLLIPELSEFVDGWEAFFMDKSDQLSISFRFILNVALKQ